MRVAVVGMVVMGLVGCAGEHEPVWTEAAFGTYAVDGIRLPRDSEQAESLGFDLDGDGRIENQGGAMLAALEGEGFESGLQAALDDAIDDGRILYLFAGVDCFDGPCAATFAGATASPAPCADENDTVCRRHLTGDGTFEIDSARGVDHEVHGTVESDGRFTGRSGALLLPLRFPGGEPIWVHVEGARTSLVTPGDTIPLVKIGGVVRDDEVQDVVLPAVHQSAVYLIDLDCTGEAPGCGCDPYSVGYKLIGVLDDDNDCEVPLEEFRDNSLIRTVARPDLDLDGDGERDALSIGVGVTAVTASYSLP